MSSIALVEIRLLGNQAQLVARSYRQVFNLEPRAVVDAFNACSRANVCARFDSGTLKTALIPIAQAEPLAKELAQIALAELSDLPEYHQQRPRAYQWVDEFDHPIEAPNVAERASVKAGRDE